MTGERGQAYTLEGIIGAIVVVSALVVGLQAVDPAPWTDPDPVDTDELGLQAQDLLEAADDTEHLQTALTCVDPASEGELASEAFEPGESGFGNMSQRMLGTANYRVSVEYVEDGEVTRETVVDTGGTPGRISVTETRQVALFENDPLYERSDGDCHQSTVTPTLGDTDEDKFYVENEDEDSELFAIVTVRVVAW